MKRISDKRRAEIDERPAILGITEPEDDALQEFVRRLLSPVESPGWLAISLRVAGAAR